MTGAESLVGYFEAQRARWQEKQSSANLGCDIDTASMWVKHYEALCSRFYAQ